MNFWKSSIHKSNLQKQPISISSVTSKKHRPLHIFPERINLYMHTYIYNSRERKRRHRERKREWEKRAHRRRGGKERGGGKRVDRGKEKSALSGLSGNLACYSLFFLFLFSLEIFLYLYIRLFGCPIFTGWRKSSFWLANGTMPCQPIVDRGPTRWRALTSKDVWTGVWTLKFWTCSTRQS